MILKFQQGGSSLPPLVSYQPVIVTGGSAQSTVPDTQTTSKGSDLTDKDLLTMLDKLDGLPNDMTEIANSLQNFYIEQAYTPSSINTTGIASKYLMILNQMKIANFNKKEYDAAYKSIEENGGLNEVAINDRGQVFCINNDGDFKLLTVEELKNSDSYQPLTNSELLYFRAQSPDLAGKNELLKVVKNGIGMSGLHSLVQEIIKNIGTTETTKEGYTSISNNKIINGIEILQEAAQKGILSKDGLSVDGLYKNELITKTQATQAQAALSYIKSMLPRNAISLLKIKSDGTEDGVNTLLSLLVTSTLNETSQFKTSLQKDFNSDGSQKSTGSGRGSNGFKMDPVSLLQAGYGQEQNITIQTSSGGSYGINVNTVKMPIVDKEGNSIGANSTLNDVTTSGFAGYLDFEHVSMGGVMLPTVGFNNVVINGTSLYTAYLPVDLEEFNSTGNIKPDIELLGRYKQAQDIITKENITDPQQINKIYKEHKLPIMFTANGDVLSNYKKFGIVNGIALEQAFNTNVSFADYLQETTDENIINNTLNTINKTLGEKNKIDFDSQSIIDDWIGTDYDRVYKGTIFIPVNEDYFTATAGFGNYPSPSEAEMIESKQQAYQRQKMASEQYVNPGRL